MLMAESAQFGGCHRDETTAPQGGDLHKVNSSGGGVEEPLGCFDQWEETLLVEAFERHTGSNYFNRRLQTTFRFQSVVIFQSLMR